MRSFCPNEIVAAIVRWSYDYVVCGQRFKRVFENRTRQVRAVTIEGNHASLTGVSWMVVVLMVFISLTIFSLTIFPFMI